MVEKNTEQFHNTLKIVPQNNKKILWTTMKQNY